MTPQHDVWRLVRLQREKGIKTLLDVELQRLDQDFVFAFERGVEAPFLYAHSVEQNAQRALFVAGFPKDPLGALHGVGAIELFFPGHDV